MRDVGDIVFLKGCEGLYWMIVDIVVNEGVTPANSIGYEIMPFYPVEEANDFIPMTVYSREIKLHAKGGSKKALDMEKLVIEELNEQKSEMRITPIPVEDFRGYVNPTKKKTRKKTNATNNDIIKYNKLTSVDDCLDAMNDLKDLHEAFGDEAYMQLREVVTKRLKELV